MLCDQIAICWSMLQGRWYSGGYCRCSWTVSAYLRQVSLSCYLNGSIGLTAGRWDFTDLVFCKPATCLLKGAVNSLFKCIYSSGHDRQLMIFISNCTEPLEPQAWPSKKGEWHTWIADDICSHRGWPANAEYHRQVCLCAKSNFDWFARWSIWYAISNAAVVHILTRPVTWC